MEKILVVDDEENILTAFNRILEDKGYNITTASNGTQAINLANNNKFDLIIMDINMPEINGLEALKKIKELKPKTPIIMMTGFDSSEITIETMSIGAYDYISKPFNITDLQALIEKALIQGKKIHSVNNDNRYNSDVEDFIYTSKDKIIGKSKCIQDISKLIGKVASSNIPVLIEGDSGTGKELFAKALYSYSSRKNKPFLAVNCAAIPETLLESELFGYEKGSFTGANERRIGKFEECNNGTLFLDEIGDMPLSLQAKILRVLQNGEIERIGSNKTIKVDVRIISATNKDLHKAISEKKFREDLYYRINVVKISVPPLRERREDIPLLIDYFIKKANKELGKKTIGIPKNITTKLQDHPWPGNIRELENVIKRAVVLSKDNLIREEDIILTCNDIDNRADSSDARKHTVSSLIDNISRDPQKSSLFDVLNTYLDPMMDNIMKLDEAEKNNIFSQIEKILINKSLRILNNNQLQTAKLLGITRNTLRNRIKSYMKLK